MSSDDHPENVKKDSEEAKKSPFSFFGLIENGLRSIDKFGIRINLSIGHRKINKSNYLTSKLGGVMSIIFVVGMLSIAV